MVRIPSALTDDALLAALCAACNGVDSASAAASFSSGVCAAAPAPAPSAAPPPPPSPLLRLAASTLVRLRVLTLARLMQAAEQASVFPADFPRFPDGAESPSIALDPRFALPSSALALDYGILLTPYYMVHGAWDAVVPSAQLCAHLGGPLAGPMERRPGTPSAAQQAQAAALDVEWDLDALLAAPGGITLSPDVDLAPVLRPGLVSPALAAELRALGGAAASPAAPALHEDYAPGSWRGALVEQVLAQSLLGEGSSSSSSSSREGGAAGRGWRVPHSALAHAAHALHSAAFSATPSRFARFAQPGRALQHFAGPQGPSAGPWLASAFAAGDWEGVKSALAAPPQQHNASLPLMLTAFDVTANDLSEVYSSAPARVLAWGGELPALQQRRAQAWEAAVGGARPAPATALTLSGCVLPGEVDRVEAAASLREVFGASVRYGDGFFHVMEGLSMAFPFLEWLRLGGGGDGAEGQGAMSPFLTLSPEYDALLDLLRLPWRRAPRVHATQRRAVRAAIYHTSDKGLCQDFKQGNLFMGRDAVRYTLGLAPGGLAGVRAAPGPPPPAPLPAAAGMQGPAMHSGLNGGGGSTPPPGALPPPDSPVLQALARGAAAGLASRTPVVALLRRSPGTPRSLSNHEELAAALLALPILLHVFDPRSLTSVPHTVRALAEADVLIGTHGAGMAHGFLLRANATVIEIAAEDVPGCLCYARMAMLAQQRYVSFIPPGSGADAGAAFNADIGGVVRAVQRAVGLPHEGEGEGEGEPEAEAEAVALRGGGRGQDAQLGPEAKGNALQSAPPALRSRRRRGKGG